MAETKTTIPVEIKMGNAGTNDANLPAFKEGSIIFTKDTKKIYIDPVGETERIAVGCGEVDLNKKQDKFATIEDTTNPYLILNFDSDGYVQTNLNINYPIIKDTSSQDKVKIDSKNFSIGETATGGVEFKAGSNNGDSFKITTGVMTDSAIPTIQFAPALNSSGDTGVVRLTGIAAPTADNDAVNRGYLTTKYGSTYYESQDQEFYFPSGSNMVIPNTNMGRLFIGSESAASTDFKIYVNDPIDGGRLIITNLKTPTNNEDAANKKYVDEMLQGKEDSITYKTHLTVGSIITDPDGGGRNTSKLESTSLSFSDKIASATLPSMLITPTTHNGTTPAYLTFASPAQNTAVGNANVRLTGIAAPTADNDAVNKTYVDTIETKITNSKVGQKLEGGEIFNDYEHNKTFGEGTSARGLNTQAGTLARKIVANGITSSADSDIMYIITVSGLVNSDELCTDAWVATDSYVEGTSDLVTVDCSTHLSNAFYISKIEENSETNTTAITIKKVDDRVVPILTMDDITGANREEDWIYVPGKLNGEISPQFTSAFAGGKNSVATGFAAMSFGRDNVSAGNYSVTLGRGNKTSYGGLAAGVYNEAGNYGTALGNSNKALGDNSVATGVGTYARAASSRAGGRYSRAESEYSVAEGLHVVTDASTPAQVVFGRYNRAHNNSLFIIGNGTSDTQRSNAFELRQNGSVWVLDGTERLATISDVNTKPGRISPNNGTLLSIYQGYTTASGNYSLASGYSKATAPYSTALGWGTASEQYAFSTGYDTMSEGFASASFGYKTKADSHSQFVVGRNNESVSNALFIVGNGSSDNSRSNAFEIYNDGHAEVQTMGTTNNSVVIKSALDTKQDKITNTTDLTVKSITALGVLKAQVYAPLDGQPSFQVFSGTIGQSSMFTFSDKKVVEFKKDSQAFSPSPMPVLGIATPISAADTTLGITDANLPYQAANKKYVDDIKTELLNAITHPYTYDETTKELTLIL